MFSILQALRVHIAHVEGRPVFSRRGNLCLLLMCETGEKKTKTKTTQNTSIHIYYQWDVTKKHQTNEALYRKTQARLLLQTNQSPF